MGRGGFAFGLIAGHGSGPWWLPSAPRAALRVQDYHRTNVLSTGEEMVDWKDADGRVMRPFTSVDRLMAGAGPFISRLHPITPTSTPFMVLQEAGAGVASPL